MTCQLNGGGKKTLRQIHVLGSLTVVGQKVQQGSLCDGSLVLHCHP